MSENIRSDTNSNTASNAHKFGFSPFLIINNAREVRINKWINQTDNK